LGAFQTSFGPLGSGEFVLATVTFNADKAGTAVFVSDPADLSPLHDVLLFEPDETAVALSRINYRTTSVIIVGSGEGENPFHNRFLQQDVNGDKSVTPQDALIVINSLNSAGPRRLLAGALGEGELSGGVTFKPDVNNDGMITSIDALQVINAISRKGMAEAEATDHIGSGSASWLDAPILPPTTAVDHSLLNRPTESSTGSEEALAMLMPFVTVPRNTSGSADAFFAEMTDDRASADPDDDLLADAIASSLFASE
jgi:hypothetical protein